MLQEAAAEAEEEEFVLTACTESGIKVTVTGMSTALPYPAEEITVTAEEKDTETEEDQLFQDPMEEEQESELIGKYLLDITLKHGEEEIEPTGPVKVTFSGLPVEGCDPKIYHIDPEEQKVTDMEVDTEENGDMTITTDHFSLYQIELRAPEAAAETTPGTLSGYIENKLTNGGTFVLNGDAFTEENGSQANLTITEDTTIDLKGHKLTISNPNQQFEIKERATLTILDSATKDSAAAKETVTTESTSSKLYGNPSTLDNDRLTYYITRSTPNTDDDETGTIEKLEKHELDLKNTGIIENSDRTGGQEQIFLVNGGTLNLESGVLKNNVNNNNKRVVCVSDGVFHMSGGYIVGGNHEKGGGVYIGNNGTMNMKAGVIAANKSKLGGGICAEGGTLDLSGGVVTGNQVDGDVNGGGIYVTNATLNLSGVAYVTNNIQKCTCSNDVNNKHGGGGIAIGNGSKMNMSGGYVTGNDAWLSGGGIYAGFWNEKVDFTMSGGTIARNHVKEGEGGGLRIAGADNGGTNGVIMAALNNKIYITNNETETPDDWGGGGIFVQHKGTLNITNALITDNSAGGFGGGIAVCPTGETLIVHAEGGAVYLNSAEGTNMSGGGNNKTADKEVAQNSKTFKENGYADFFCVRNKGADNVVSLVTGEMLGDGAANWKGSCDEKPVKISKSGYAAAKYLFGLTSNPDANAIADAKKAAKVIISGNHSNIHGGGIMTNGGLILGETEENNIVTTTPSLNISGTKVLLKDGVAQSSGRKFKFQLTDERGTVVGEATSDEVTGVFTISPNETYKKEGTYCYYLSEVDDKKSGMVYDTARYKIEIPITEHKTELLGVNFVSYKVNPEKVMVTKEGDSSTVKFNGTANADGSYSLEIEGDTFTNNMTTPLALKLVKTDEDNEQKRLPGATFTLKKKADGTTTAMTTNDSGEATFSGIEKGATYYLYETEPPEGYMTAGPWILEIQDNKGVFYPAKENEDGTTLVKTTETGTEIQFDNASGDTIVLEMKISDQSWGYKLPDTGGLGTTGYRTGGLALVVCALAWKYILTKRRKEDEISS